MKISGTIPVTCGGTGSGRALAEAFYQRGNQVITAGQRQTLTFTEEHHHES